ncbi:hypothetical protein AVEN_264123-1 [Araneus ventricosus]|uniref:Uncharacterized protein n=1 Tax=Araneus ventricosus TaxID=182803 RepID=A0A4Y2RQL0_ARAVE|nr:hypothetical protein AVEN_264123-1 [Araneus ventricosus]
MSSFAVSIDHACRSEYRSARDFIRVSCPREMSHYNGHHLNWPETPIGEDTFPDEMCVTDESDEPPPSAEFAVVHSEDNDVEFEDYDEEHYSEHYSGDEGINGDFFQFWFAGEKADNQPPTPSKPYNPNNMEFWDTDPFEMSNLLSALPLLPQTFDEREKKIRKDVEWLRFYEATLTRNANAKLFVISEIETNAWCIVATTKLREKCPDDQGVQS